MEETKEKLFIFALGIALGASVTVTLMMSVLLGFWKVM